MNYKKIKNKTYLEIGGLIKYSLALIVLSLISLGAYAENKLFDLSVDYETNPRVIENPKPVFSWKLASGAQKKFSIKVLTEKGVPVWSSGVLDTDMSVGVDYAGAPLMPKTKYLWHVAVWDDSGSELDASAWFETGFMGKQDKVFPGSKWIGGDPSDLPFWSNYLTVFKLNFDIRLDQKNKTERARFLFGGNDPRLLDRNFNLMGVSSENNEAYIALELNIKKLLTSQGTAELNIYRAGYINNEDARAPLVSLKIPESIINPSNLYKTHRFYLESVFGLINIYIDGQDNEHRITLSADQQMSYIPQGLNLNPMAFGGALKPSGGPGDYVAYPALASIGFSVAKGQAAYFSNIEVRNYRKPSNILFAAGKPFGNSGASVYPEIFVGSTNDDELNRAANGAYYVNAKYKSVKVLADPSRLSTPMLRTEFSLASKKIISAKIYATARGIYELYVNGARVGESYFAPGLAQYNKHQPYQSYDVTSLLKAGRANALGVWMSEGWWSGNITYTGTNWNYFGDRQSFLGKLIVTYADGTEQSINTDPGSWKVFLGGPIRYGSLFQGEIYDARLEKRVGNWSQPDFDAKDWKMATEVPLEGSAYFDKKYEGYINREQIYDYDNADLTGQLGESPGVVDRLVAKSVRKIDSGVYIYDMGQNMVGFPQISLKKSTVGQRITLRYAEMLYPELPKYKGLSGKLMTENFRAAMVQDVFFAKGGAAVIHPRFTFHGYRYLEVSGIDKPLPLAAVQGLVISSVKSLDADYETSNPLVNKLWKNITWSMRGNFLSIPTDTPARNERMGWSGDLNMFARTAGLISNLDPFLRRHMLALKDIQAVNGRFPDVAPLGGGFGGILWGSLGVTIPWELYLQYGDLATLKENYPAMKHYADYLWGRIDPASNILLDGPLGDWLSPENNKNDNTLLWESYHLHVLDVLSKSAGLLGKLDDMALFKQHYAQRKEFFNRTYFDQATGRSINSGMIAGFIVDPAKAGKVDKDIKGKFVDSQASYAIPIMMGVLTKEVAANAMNNLAETVLRHNADDQGVIRPTCSLMTGFIGTASLMPALSKANRPDVAYCLLQQESYPSWLYSVVNGSTTIWERLNSYTSDDGFGQNNSMNSFNHYSFGAVGAWMIGDSLGIKIDENSPAFKHIIFKPQPDPSGRMTWARGYINSMYGHIKSEWKIEGDTIVYSFSVPANTTASFYVHAENPGGLKAIDDDGRSLQITGFNNGLANYELKPGNYRVYSSRAGIGMH